MPIDFPLEKEFCLLFPELHRYELHCPVNYYKCFISLQSIENLPLVLILVLYSQDMPSPYKDLSGSIFCFIQMVFRLKLTQLHCVLRNSAFYFFKNILQLLTILALHFVTVTAYFLKVSVTSIAQCKDPTVIGTFAIILFAMITLCSLQIQLALPKPLANFFTPIVFCSHAFQFVYNLEKILETILSLSCSILLTLTERHTS